MLSQAPILEALCILNIKSYLNVTVIMWSTLVQICASFSLHQALVCFVLYYLLTRR